MNDAAETPTEASAAPRRRLPVESILIAIGAAVLVLVSYWIGASPRPPRTAAGSAISNPGAALGAALDQRLAEIEAATRRDPPGLIPLAARLHALETRPAPVPEANPRLTALETRLRSLEQRPAPDLTQLTGQLQELARNQAELAEDIARLRENTPALEARMASLAAMLSSNARTIFVELQRNTRTLEALRERLAAGEPFGALLDRMGRDEPALAHFATTAPPTEAALRLRFDDLAATLHPATLAAPAAAKAPRQGFWANLWARLKALVSIRRADQPAPTATPTEPGVERLRRLLMAGDLAAAEGMVGTLSPAAQATLAPWAEQAGAVLAARQALRKLATGED